MVESTVIHDVVVDVPVRTAYNQWTQFEDFPKFMGGVEQVVQRGDDQVHFKINVGGHIVEYDARILEQVPDTRIVWQSTSGKETGGIVNFESLGHDRTRVTLTLGYAPEGALEKVGDLLNIVSLQTRRDLANFKKFIESQGAETGAWRGSIGPKPGNS
jgi:uncharacterized membrane protein